MSRQLDAAEMQALGHNLVNDLAGLGFILITTEFHKHEPQANYVSNMSADSVVNTLQTMIDKLQSGHVVRIPNQN